MHKTGLPADHGLPGFHLPLYISFHGTVLIYISFHGTVLKRTVHAIIRAWILMKGDTYGTI